jgi:hypothetical protein
LPSCWTAGDLGPGHPGHIPGGSGIITGRFTVEETTQLAILLRAGALPAEMTFLEERTIGPELGQDSIDAGHRCRNCGDGGCAGLHAAQLRLFRCHRQYRADLEPVR